MPQPSVLIFYALAAVILASAILVVTRKSPVSSAVALVVTLLSVAVLYLTLWAEFLFAVQVLVYTGGVMVLFVFVIMLVNVEEIPLLRAAIRSWWWPAAFCALVGAVLVTATLGSRRLGEAVRPAGLPEDNVRAVAEALFVKYLLPFEIVSVLLLVAMVGAIILSRREA